MHKTGCHQNGAENRNPSHSKQAPQKIIEDRKHQDARKRARETPSERSHAKQDDSDGKKLLSERRMGDFIGPNAVQMLPRGPCVIDLIKIGRIQIMGCFRDQELLIRQFWNSGND